MKLCGYIAAGDLSVVAQDGEYLGQLVPSGINSRYTSVCDMHSWQSIKPYANPYGNPYEEFSPHNPYTDHPPLIVTASGTKMGYVTKRPIPIDFILDSFDPDDVLDALGC